MAAPTPAAGDPDRRVLVPIKSFAAAKGRLGVVLGDTDRAALVRSMAAHVLAAAAPLCVWVACDDLEVAAFAESHGASVAWTPGLGLNGAVVDTIRRLHAEGCDFVTVVHADLPLATGIGSLPHHDGVTVAPDRHGRGTNLLRVPAGAGFTTRFGRDSLQRHLDEAVRLGLPVTVLDREDLAFDVDVPTDLADLTTRRGGTP